MAGVVYPLSRIICNNTLQWYNIMYYVYSNIQNYFSSEHHSGIINIVSSSDDLFLILFPGRRLSGTGYHDSILMYAEQVAKDAISEMQNISRLHIHSFINYDVLSIGSLIDPYNNWVKPRIFWLSHHVMNILFILMWYF